MQYFGLDFGTTNSSLAWACEDGSVRLCDLDLRAARAQVLRSLLYFSLDARDFVVGQRAIDEYLSEDMQGTLIQSIKTFLADDSFERTWIHDRYYALEDLIAVILRHVRAAIAELTEDEVVLIMGRPAVFANDPDREAVAQRRLTRAAQLAGFFELRFLYEPIAAGLAYEASLDKPEIALIADLGGGTSDFTVMRLGSGTGDDRRGDVLASGGVQIGGDIFDARIMWHKLTRHFGAGTTFRSMEGKAMPFPKYLLARLGQWHQIPFLRAPKSREVLRRIRWQSSHPEVVAAFEALVEGNYAFFLFREIEAAKSRLSEQDVATIRFQRGEIDIEETITRQEFEACTAAERERIRECMRGVLEQAGVSSAEVQSIFLTGGSAQIPCIRDMFAAEFGADRLKAQDFLTSVATGLGHAAAALGA